MPHLWRLPGGRGWSRFHLFRFPSERTALVSGSVAQRLLLFFFSSKTNQSTSSLSFFNAHQPQFVFKTNDTLFGESFYFGFMFELHCTIINVWKWSSKYNCTTHICRIDRGTTVVGAVKNFLGQWSVLDWFNTATTGHVVSAIIGSNWIRFSGECFICERNIF